MTTFEDELIDTIGGYAHLGEITPDTLTDGIGVNQTAQLKFIYLGLPTDTIGGKDVMRFSPVIPVVDGIGLSAVSSTTPGASATDSFNITVSESVQSFLKPIMSELLGVQALVSFGRRVDLTETVGLQDVLVYGYTGSRELLETIGIDDPALVMAKLAVVVVEQPGMQDVYILGRPVSLTDTAGVAGVLQQVRHIAMLEQLGLSRVVSASTIRGLTLVERVQLHDVLARFFSGDLTDGLGLTQVLQTFRITPKQLSDAVTVGDELTPQLVLRLVVSDELNVSDEQLMRWVFSPTLAETVEFSVGYVAPDGTFTTWAVNTKTGGVTEYTNFSFNSFAQMGHKYIAASGDGLYELNGDTDDGTAIIAQIKSGFAQFGGSRFTSFKAAYLGLRATGDFVLKLETGDGKQYVYAAVAKNMQTSRVHMGKGLRARYFSFELISTGQDFDLDAVEFVPLVMQRRV